METHKYGISEISNHGHYFTLHRLSMTPQVAAKHNLEAFQELAAEVERVIRKIKQDQAQLEMPLGETNE